MTESTGSESSPGGENDASRASSGSDLPLAALRPLMEGARARGVADACELLGVAAVLLDQAGTVLHLTSAARAVMGEALDLVGGHLVAPGAETNRTIERLIGAALSGTPCEEAIDGRNLVQLRLRAMPLPGAGEDEAQLLKAVLFLTEGESLGAAAAPSNVRDAAVRAA